MTVLLHQRDRERRFHRAIMLWRLWFFGIRSYFLGFVVFPYLLFPSACCRLEVVLCPRFPMDAFNETAIRTHSRLPFFPSVSSADAFL